MKHLTKIAAMFCVLGTCQFGWGMQQQGFRKSTIVKDLLGKIDKFLSDTYMRNAYIDPVLDSNTIIEATIFPPNDNTENKSEAHKKNCAQWQQIFRDSSCGERVQQKSLDDILYQAYANKVEIYAVFYLEKNQWHYTALIQKPGLLPVIINGICSVIECITGFDTILSRTTYATHPSIAQSAESTSTGSSSSSSASAATATSSASSSSASATTVPATTSASASATSSSTLSQETNELFNRAMPAVIAMTMAAFTHGSQAAKKQ